MNYWDKKLECIGRDQIYQIQLERLQATLNRVYKNVIHYKKTFREIDFFPEDLISLDDLKNLPFSTRQNLKDNYPYGMFAVPLREIVRLDAPIPGFDKPVVMGYTANDLKIWAKMMARVFKAGGVDKDDVVQVTLPFRKMTALFGTQLGTELLGASALPMSGNKFSAQLKIMKDFRTTVLVSTPGFALELVNLMGSLNVDPISLSLKSGFFTAEPWSQEIRQEIESAFNISSFDVYGLTEVFGLGVGWECVEKNGLHISEDHFIAEIIDPTTLKSLEPGQEGELVLTTISKQAFPLIRFRTGDICSIDYKQCSCNRTFCRISRIAKRCDGVIVMKGTCVVPEQIGKIITKIIGVTPNYQLNVEKNGNQEELTILVEVLPDIFFDEMKRQRRFVEQLTNSIAEFLGWFAFVKLVEPGTFDSNFLVNDKRLVKNNSRQ